MRVARLATELHRFHSTGLSFAPSPAAGWEAKRSTTWTAPWRKRQNSPHLSQ